MVDVDNLLNAGTVLTQKQTFGANPATRVWLNPTSIQTARYIRFGGQFSF